MTGNSRYNKAEPPDELESVTVWERARRESDRTAALILSEHFRSLLQAGLPGHEVLYGVRELEEIAFLDPDEAWACVQWLQESCPVPEGWRGTIDAIAGNQWVPWDEFVRFAVEDVTEWMNARARVERGNQARYLAEAANAARPVESPHRVREESIRIAATSLAEPLRAVTLLADCIQAGLAIDVWVRAEIGLRAWRHNPYATVDSGDIQGLGIPSRVWLVCLFGLKGLSGSIDFRLAEWLLESLRISGAASLWSGVHRLCDAVEGRTESDRDGALRLAARFLSGESGESNSMRRTVAWRWRERVHARVRQLAQPLTDSSREEIEQCLGSRMA